MRLRLQKKAIWSKFEATTYFLLVFSAQGTARGTAPPNFLEWSHHTIWVPDNPLLVYGFEWGSFAVGNESDGMNGGRMRCATNRKRSHVCVGDLVLARSIFEACWMIDILSFCWVAYVCHEYRVTTADLFKRGYGSYSRIDCSQNSNTSGHFAMNNYKKLAPSSHLLGVVRPNSAHRGMRDKKNILQHIV